MPGLDDCERRRRSTVDAPSHPERERRWQGVEGMERKLKTMSARQRMVAAVLFALVVAAGIYRWVVFGNVNTLHGSSTIQTLTGEGEVIGSTSTAAQPATPQRCPATDAKLESSPDLTTGRELVPPHPVGTLVCRYWGNHDVGQRGTLAGERAVEANRALSRLITRLDALEPERQPLPSCPVFGGRSILLLFHYRGASDDPVRILRETCPKATNGRLTRLALGLSGGEHWPDEGLL
jgi:hypothetical protein